MVLFHHNIEITENNSKQAGAKLSCLGGFEFDLKIEENKNNRGGPILSVPLIQVICIKVKID